MAIFEWDFAKAQSNVRKHGVSFDMAIPAFADPFAIVEQDRIEGGERRWRLMGFADSVLILVVAYTIRDGVGDDDIIRIISARTAQPRERRSYERSKDRSRRY